MVAQVGEELLACAGAHHLVQRDERFEDDLGLVWRSVATGLVGRILGGSSR